VSENFTAQGSKSILCQFDKDGYRARHRTRHHYFKRVEVKTFIRRSLMPEYIDSNSIDLDHLRSEIDTKGYCIQQEVIDPKYIDLQQLRWNRKIALTEELRKFVRGNLILGEENFLSYSNIPKWSLYRYYEFLWNATDDPDRLGVHLQLNKIRNLLKGDNQDRGVMLNEECYGVYISTSLYQNDGYLYVHADGHGEDPILHYMLPLTFKSSEFNDGGLVIWDKNNNKINVEDRIRKGSVIFFDGRQKHAVEKIAADEGQLGRLASFAIPCYFQKDTRLALFKRRLQVSLDEMRNKIGARLAIKR
jgi:hypothetical protein